MKNIVVLLCGCGHKDGSEIHEAAYTILSLSQLNAKITFIALDENQFDVINHATDDKINENRNILVESTRISRTKVFKISEISPNNVDGLIIPGGFGAAKNICNFAFKGVNANFNPKVKKFIKKVNELNKPIGAICIAPALLSIIFGEKKVKLTIGNDENTALEIQKTGAIHVNKKVDEICVDENLKIVSTPAFMYSQANFAQVFSGINKLVKKVLQLA